MNSAFHIEVAAMFTRITLSLALIVFIVNFSPAQEDTKNRYGNLRQVGSSWMSPQGLVYKGTDSDGLPRPEHVLTHLRDDATRRGNFGVFDGQSGDYFRAIDKAWEMVHSQAYNDPRVVFEPQGDREIYYVDLDRR